MLQHLQAVTVADTSDIDWIKLWLSSIVSALSWPDQWLFIFGMFG